MMDKNNDNSIQEFYMKIEKITKDPKNTFKEVANIIGRGFDKWGFVPHDGFKHSFKCGPSIFVVNVEP